MKKVAIVGSRDFKRREIIEEFMSNLQNVEIVTGGARGVDKIAEWVAKRRGLPVTVFKPDFSKGYDITEYHKRNRKIAEYADEVHIFWHKPTPGSSSTLRYAAVLGKPVFVHEIKNEDKDTEEMKRKESELFTNAMSCVFRRNRSRDFDVKVEVNEK